MSIWSELLRTGQEFTVLVERVDRLRAEVDNMTADLANHAERLVRIETLIDIAGEHARRPSDR